ncbi:MAG: TfoX/Sxy family protein [Marinosulfonomonas sp.]|nr:TfoX/Sxy family protein [Marinosulfonomonas sp.]
MPADPGFLDHALDLFANLAPIRTGRLFGGTALYSDDAMFAVIFGDAVFMKADKELAHIYSAAGSQPFTYDTKTGPRQINGLMALPDAALEDSDEAMHWAQLSMVPALKAAAQKRAKKAKRKP